MNENRKTSTLLSILAVVVVIGFVLAGTSESTYAQMRLEMRPVETVTLSTQQLLMGDRNGKPVVLAGELRFPSQAPTSFPPSS